MFKKLSLIVTIVFIVSQTVKSEPLLCYVGGTMRPAVEQLAKAFSEKTGQKIEVDYSSSGEAMIKAKQTGKGDIIVVHDPYLGAILNTKLGNKGWNIATVHGVIVVPKGNPKAIKSFDDLARPGIKLVLTDPQYSTLGHVMAIVIEKSGHSKQIKENLVTTMKESGAAANAVIMGTADAAVVWNAVASLRKEKLDTITIDKKYSPVKGVDAVTSATFGKIEMAAIRVTAARLSSSKQPDLAEKFAEFLASPESQKIWIEEGFSAVPSDMSAPMYASGVSAAINGGILVHCAAGMRKPIERCAKKFGDSLGIKVELSYDGSNRLLGQIELTRKGDVYICGDAEYADSAKIKGLVHTMDTICWFTPVILVNKGNPKKILLMKDLTKPGIKIGQGDEKSAAVGKIIPKLLALNHVDETFWKKNVVLITPTVTELGNAVKLGTVDAVIVWNSIASGYIDIGEIVPIERKVAASVEAVALTTSLNMPAAKTFIDFLKGAAGRKILTEAGYDVDKNK